MQQQNVSDDEGMKPLLVENNYKPKENRVVGMLKAKKWIIIFGCALILAIAIIVAFVATKSSSSSYCGSNSNSDSCFFKGNTPLVSVVKPLTYTIRLQPDLDTFLFNGSSEMVVKCVKHTNRVVFHQKGLKFDKTDVSIEKQSKGNPKAQYQSIKIDEMHFDTEHEEVIIKVKGWLEEGNEYKITVYFNGKLNDKLEGFYKSSYKTKSGETRYLATTHFEPTTARQAFPCFDEPALKANFTIVIVHPLKYVALSNMPAESSKILENNLNETTFMPSVKMSTYLVAFVVCDFKYVQNTTEHGVKVRVWVPEDVIKEASLALTSASVILDYYENYFDIRYPLPKQDLIAIPDFSAGAMENWGLITYRLTSLLIDPDESSSSNKQWVATVVAHELAHQWFGNLVTMKWWDDLWLNEGFASYMENVGVNIFQPKWKMMDQFILTSIQRSLHLDQLANSHPISASVKNPNEIASLFDDISYHKGASLINMLSHVLGRNVFLKGIQSYLKTYKFGNAATDDLWNSFSKFTDVKVKEVMDTWTAQMGFPLVTITKVQEGVYRATQEHFLINPNAKPALPSPYHYKWQIPLVYRTDRDDKSLPVQWMEMEDTTINVNIDKNGWLKVNHQQNGFYRVNYPIENWKNILNTMKTDHKKLSAADRAGLIDDAFSLARAGKLSYSLALETSSHLHKEHEYVVWSTAMNNLAYIGSRLAVTPYYGIFQKYMLSKITPVLDLLQYEDKGEHLQKFLRDVLFAEATIFDYKPATDKASKLFEGFMKKNERVPPNFRYNVYSHGVRNGGRIEWEFMWDKYQREIIASEKKKILSSLTDSRRPWLLQSCLEYSMNNSLIKSQDADSVIAHVAGTPNGRLLAWDFFRLNWDELQRRYGSEAFTFGRLLKAIVAHFQTDFHYKEAQSFFAEHSDVATAKRSLQQSYESIRDNIHWVKTYQKEVVEWLQDNLPQ